MINNSLDFAIHIIIHDVINLVMEPTLRKGVHGLGRLRPVLGWAGVKWYKARASPTIFYP